jgi:hypothetical protein
MLEVCFLILLRTMHDSIFCPDPIMGSSQLNPSMLP